jgi:hypothetical protein
MVRVRILVFSGGLSNSIYWILTTLSFVTIQFDHCIYKYKTRNFFLPLPNQEDGHGRREGEERGRRGMCSTMTGQKIEE